MLEELHELDAAEAETDVAADIETDPDPCNTLLTTELTLFKKFEMIPDKSIDSEALTIAVSVAVTSAIMLFATTMTTFKTV